MIPLYITETVNIPSTNLQGINISFVANAKYEGDKKYGHQTISNSGITRAVLISTNYASRYVVLSIFYSVICDLGVQES